MHFERKGNRKEKERKRKGNWPRKLTHRDCPAQKASIFSPNTLFNFGIRYRNGPYPKLPRFQNWIPF
jgi:hypothetical protein